MMELGLRSHNELLRVYAVSGRSSRWFVAVSEGESRWIYQVCFMVKCKNARMQDTTYVYEKINYVTSLRRYSDVMMFWLFCLSVKGIKYDYITIHRGTHWALTSKSFAINKTYTIFPVLPHTLKKSELYFLGGIMRYEYTIQRKCFSNPDFFFAEGLKASNPMSRKSLPVSLGNTGSLMWLKTHVSYLRL